MSPKDASGRNNQVRFSVIIPIYNEEKNLPTIIDEITSVLSNFDSSHEIIFIDDGSGDNSFEILKEYASKNQRIRIIQFTRNFGQTSALYAGIQHTRGKYIITMDGDLQNDPYDIPMMHETLKKGYDIVCGWRKHRKDNLFTKKLPSFIANKLISLITGLHLHDYGCTLKIFKREFIEPIKLYGEMHRFIPALGKNLGARITEVTVNHRKRKHGKSNYGLTRIIKVTLDLLTVSFMGSYLSSPIYFFGGLGFVSCLLGILCGIITLLQKYLSQVKAHRNPLLLLAIFLFIIGVQFIILGVLAEIIVKSYYESKDIDPYVVKKIIN
jgi:glycosyltransferase involved in cell wall biosynthesis